MEFVFNNLLLSPIVLILAPVFGFIILFLFADVPIIKSNTKFIGPGTVLVSFLTAFTYLLNFLFVDAQVILFEKISWFHFSNFIVNWTFIMDPLSTIMVLVITGVSFCVHYYSVEYMGLDPHFTRFMSFLNLFTFFMLMMVLSGNMAQLFLGWEGVGLSSYLLINFWHTRLEANKSSLKAIVMNRIGDCFLLGSMALMFIAFGTLDLLSIFSVAEQYATSKVWLLGVSEVHLLSFLSFLIFMGAIAKSAQLGLHTWLPDAMEGPTPVSALLHAATMVTAGVYLIVRFSPIFEYAPKVLAFTAVIGGLTAVFGSSVAACQSDLKKVIAFSTCSQLGYMFAACGVSAYNVAMFHLVTHATFKALLFLSAGAIIHSLNNEQDMRRMGGMINFIPLTFTFMLIGFSSLGGFPFLSGFYSKDMILEVCYAHYSVSGLFAFLMCLISAFLTAFYSFRVLYFVFLAMPNFTNSKRLSLDSIHDMSILMFTALAPLAIGSIFLGYYIKDTLVGLGTSFWLSSIFFKSSILTYFDAEFLPVIVKLSPTIFGIIGFGSSIVMYLYFFNEVHDFKLFNHFGRYTYTVLAKKWLFDVVYNKFLTKFGLWFGNVTFSMMDRGLFEYIGPYGISKAMDGIATLFSLKVQNGLLSFYLVIMVVSVFGGIVVLLTL